MAPEIDVQYMQMAPEPTFKDLIEISVKEQPMCEDVDGATYWFQTSGQDLTRTDLGTIKSIQIDSYR
jgi:hypothetical protein